jgi:hypothetical protein
MGPPARLAFVLCMRFAPAMAHEISPRYGCGRDARCATRAHIEVVKTVQVFGAIIETPSRATIERNMSDTAASEPTPQDLLDAPLPPPLPPAEIVINPDGSLARPSTPAENLSVWLAFFACGLLIYVILRLYRGTRADRAIDKYVKSQAHLFSSKKSQMSSTDNYGIHHAGAWEEEKKYIASVVIPQHLQKCRLPRAAITRATRNRSLLVKKIEIAASSVASAHRGKVERANWILRRGGSSASSSPIRETEPG